MAPDFVSFLLAVFFCIELVTYKHICKALISDCPSNVKNETARTTSYPGTIHVKKC